MKTCFGKIAEISEIRAVVLSGSGRMFTAGRDFRVLRFSKAIAYDRNCR